MAAVRSNTRTPGCAYPGRALLSVLFLAVGATAGCAEAVPQRHEITIRGFQYHPSTLTVAAGDTVVWINEDVVPHTATSTDRRWDTGSIESKNAGQVVISREGEHPYLCAFHPNMRAELATR